MASSDVSVEAQANLRVRQTEKEVFAIGKKLLKFRENNEKLPGLLEEAKSVLADVRQDPSASMRTALIPILQALIHYKLLRHTEPKIQLQVAVLHSEMMRVTAPVQPYDDGLMREIFLLFLLSFKYLCGEPVDAYLKALDILHKMASFKTMVLLLDLPDYQALAGMMFQRFFTAIKFNPYPFMFACMEKTISSVIEYSDEFSPDILKPLLASVEKANEGTAPASFQLGVKIFENNSRKLRSWLLDADKQMEFTIDDYSRIVRDVFFGHYEKIDIKVPIVTFKDLEQSHFSMLESGFSTSDAEGIISNTKTGPSRSVISTEEMYRRRLTEVNKLCERLRSQINDENKKDVVGSQSKQGKRGKKKTTSGSSPKELDSVADSSGLVKKRISKNKDKAQIPDSKSKEVVSSSSKKTVKSSISGSSGISLEKGSAQKGKDIQAGSCRGKDDEHFGRQEIKGKVIIEKDDSNTTDAKMGGSEAGSSKKKKHKKNSASGKKKVELGEELVNVRIKVYKPMDNTFYTGTIHSYDRLTKMHKILFDDDGEEILNLKTTKWEPFHEERLLIANPPESRRRSPTNEPIKVQTTSSKKNTGLFNRFESESADKSVACLDQQNYESICSVMQDLSIRVRGGNANSEDDISDSN